MGYVRNSVVGPFYVNYSLARVHYVRDSVAGWFYVNYALARVHITSLGKTKTCIEAWRAAHQ